MTTPTVAILGAVDKISAALASRPHCSAGVTVIVKEDKQRKAWPGDEAIVDVL